MVSRKKQTRPLTPGAPVRFYKIVALSFLFLTIVLLSVIVFMSSKRATITITTRPQPIEVSMEAVVGTEGARDVDVSGVVTTTEVSATQTFSPTGNKEVPGVATGVVTLINESNTAQPLVATTRLLTPDGVLFRLRERVVVPANGTVEADVYADQEGPAGNIEPVERFTIPGLNAARQQEVYATSDTAMEGGVRTIGILSQTDMDKAQKVLLATLEDRAKQMISQAFPDLAGVYTITASEVESDVELGEEVSEFALSGSATVVGVLYQPQAVATLAEEQLETRAVDDTEIVEKDAQAPQVTLDSYDLEEGTATIDVFHTGAGVLNPESKQIQKHVFFGKTRDEVRRYLLSLEHVHGVEVEFRPVWMLTVPHVPDHVQVIVKRVE